MSTNLDSGHHHLLISCCFAGSFGCNSTSSGGSVLEHCLSYCAHPQGSCVLPIRTLPWVGFKSQGGASSAFQRHTWHAMILGKRLPEALLGPVLSAAKASRTELHLACLRTTWPHMSVTAGEKSAVDPRELCVAQAAVIWGDPNCWFPAESADTSVYMGLRWPQGTVL
jgi:hypothetical protein